MMDTFSLEEDDARDLFITQTPVENLIGVINEQDQSDRINESEQRMGCWKVKECWHVSIIQIYLKMKGM